MKLRVFFFGKLGDLAGRERNVDVPGNGCSVAELRRLLADTDPSMAQALGRPDVRVAVDQETVGDDARIEAGQDVAFFPLVSGG